MYQHQKVLILGLGISGKAAAQFLLKRGASVWGMDKNAAVLKDIMGVHLVVEGQPLDVKQFDFIVASPGIPQTHPCYQQALKLGIEVIGEVELACRGMRHKMIGITGTNGKTTVTSLVTHVLNECGIPARALGNIGAPLTAELENVREEEIIVAELSSYQLETLRSKVLDAGVILNITPDHLDRYNGMEEYAKAKICIKDCMRPGAPLYIEETIQRDYKALLGNYPYKFYGYSAENEIYTDLNAIYQEGHLLSYLPSSLVGKRSHDLENILAALALCLPFGVSAIAFFKAFETFKKPSHRIEFVKCHRDISFYDDSKGTNIDAVVRAVEVMNGPVWLIAGGVDKGAAYTPWTAAFGDKVKGIYAIGQAASKIHEDLSNEIPVHLCKKLEDAVEKAYKCALPGDNILLSPGCSSFDMFKDYAHRGEEFQRIVNQLILSGEQP